MNRRLTAKLCVVCAAVLIALPTPAFARSASQIRAELHAVEGKVQAAGRVYERSMHQLEDTRYRIALNDRRMRAQTRKLARSEKLLGQRMDAMYRTGDEAGMLAFLLGATTFEDFITRADLATMIGDRDASLVLHVKRTRVALARSRRELVVERRRQAVEAAAFRKKRDVLQRQLAGVQARYQRLLGELDAARQREMASGRTTWAPRGPNGMVFPVRGAHYYSNTWGAARSGGRRHMGTDIMSPRGTPVVAVSSGRADPHYNGLGGKSITLTGSNGWVYYYAHLNSYAVGSGHVSAGQLIGYVGSTGNAAGGAPHLHFQMGPGGRWTNPYYYLRQMQ